MFVNENFFFRLIIYRSHYFNLREKLSLGPGFETTSPTLHAGPGVNFSLEVDNIEPTDRLV